MQDLFRQEGVVLSAHNILILINDFTLTFQNIGVIPEHLHLGVIQRDHMLQLAILEIKIGVGVTALALFFHIVPKIIGVDTWIWLQVQRLTI